MTQLVRYDAMVTAIAECHSVDEVKDMADKAQALELYARQAKNTDAERKAADIRLRAERRCGELLRDLKRETPQTANPSGKAKDPPAMVAAGSEYASVIGSAGLSDRTARRYQELANVPAATFESHLRDPVRKPTANAIIAADKPGSPDLDDASLWVWSTARAFEREGLSRKSAAAVMAGMTDAMRADVARVLPTMIDLFKDVATFVDEAQQA